MAYITATTLQDAIAARLGLSDRTQLPAHWQAVAADAVDSAYMMIRSVLISRNITPAEIDAWEFAALWNKMLGLYHAFVNASQAGKDYGEHIDKLEVWEKNLHTVLLVANTPADGTPEPPTRVTSGSRATADTVMPHVALGGPNYYGPGYGGGYPPSLDSDDTTGLRDIVL